MITSNSIISLLEKLETTNYHDVIKELLSLYSTKDFKESVREVSSKYKISSLDLVLLYMNTTGTLESELPDNYSLKDFKGGDKKPKSSEYSEPVTKRGRTSGGFFS